MEFSVPGIVRGYHVYQRIWTPFVGERATTVREPDNEHDRYAVAVLEDETLCTVGHLPREISASWVPVSSGSFSLSLSSIVTIV